MRARTTDVHRRRLIAYLDTNNKTTTHLEELEVEQEVRRAIWRLAGVLS